MDNQLTLIQDTREVLGYGDLFSIPYEVGTIQTGDYALKGCETLVAVERKSLGDLVGSLTQDRRRFEDEMKRSRLLHRFWVVVESSPQEILRGAYRSAASPQSIWESLIAFTVRYGCFLFAHDREHGAKLTQSLLTKYYQQHVKVVQAVARATKGKS